MMVDLSPEALNKRSDTAIVMLFENACRREGVSRVGTEEFMQAYKEMRVLRDELLTRLEYYASLTM